MINVLEQINVPDDAGFPITIGYPFSIVSMWIRADLAAPIMGTGRIVVTAPNGEVKELPAYPISLEKYRRFRHRFNIQGFQAPEPSVHIFDIELLDDGSGADPRYVASIPLEIVHK